MASYTRRNVRRGAYKFGSAYKGRKPKMYRRKKFTMGKMFRTRKGKYGCYKYVNGRRVAFVRKSKR